MYAIAIDLGTTTLAVSLLDTASGNRSSITGSMNPQRSFGTDVISRLDSAVHSDDKLKEMSAIIRSELLRLCRKVCANADISWLSINRIAIAGNPAMQHILLELPVQSLAFPPYRPVTTKGITVAASELGWDNNAAVYVFPMPGGFVGGDTVAFLYSQLVAETFPQSPALYLDMGTNSEMALLEGDTIWATSAAAGPSFEGGNLTCGMPALPGAINSLCIEDDRLKITTIGNHSPTGICGSAVLQTTALLLKNSILENNGRILNPTEIPSNLATRIIDIQGENAFLLYRDASQLLALTQGDIRQIQLAKSAIRAGMEVLAERSGIQFEALQDLVLTGSFGAVLLPECLKTIGIFDDKMVHICRFVSEGVLAGAEQAIMADDDFASVENLAARFRVIPLSGTPLFEKQFIRHIDFCPDMA